MPRVRLAADAALVLVTLIWGSTFVVVKVAVESVDPAVFVALRFGTGALLLGLLYARHLRSGGRTTLAAGALLGLALLTGFLLQTFGLRLTTPSRAGFITGLSVVFVPLLDAALFRRRPTGPALTGVALSAVGMTIISAPTGDAGGDWRGDLLVLGCALAFALHIVGVGHFAARHDARAITTIQIATVAVLAGAAAAVTRFDLPSQPAAWLAVAYMGILATALVFLLQSWAQVHTSATHTALIFALEPVFAALFASTLYGEALGPRALIGGTLIVAGMLVAELRPASS